MKKMLAVMGMGLLLSGCANFGLMAKVQQADDVLAAKYGIPASAVAKARSILGIPVVKDLPTADRVLPMPYVWYYDVLDRDEKVVDVTGYHYGTIPHVRQNDAKAAPVNVVNPIAPGVPAADGTATLEALLQLISANPSLLSPAK